MKFDKLKSAKPPKTNSGYLKNNLREKWLERSEQVDKILLDGERDSQVALVKYKL